MIKLLVMDVDGTLTDGKIYMGVTGEVMKAFNIKDGYGIHELLPLHGIKSAIITGRSSEIVINRAKELDVDYICQSVKDKKSKLEELCEQMVIGTDEVAYIGDDIIDLLPMQVCGICGCPLDAANEIKEICNYISPYKGGEGAVRDFIEWIIKRSEK